MDNSVMDEDEDEWLYTTRYYRGTRRQERGDDFFYGQTLVNRLLQEERDRKQEGGSYFPQESNREYRCPRWAHMLDVETFDEDDTSFLTKQFRKKVSVRGGE